MPYHTLPQKKSYRKIFIKKERLLKHFLTSRLEELADLDVSHALKEAMREGYFGLEIIRSPLLRWTIHYEDGILSSISSTAILRTCVHYFLHDLYVKWEERGIREFCIVKDDDRIYVVLLCLEKYVKMAPRSIKPANFD